MRTDTGICDKCKKNVSCLMDCTVNDELIERLCPTCLKEDGNYCLSCGDMVFGLECFCDTCQMINEEDNADYYDEDEEDFPGGSLDY